MNFFDPLLQIEDETPATAAREEVPSAPLPEEEEEEDGFADNPLIIALFALICLYVVKLYVSDYKDNVRGNPHPKAFPGAWPASGLLLAIGVLGAFLLVGIETAGEYVLGVAAEGSEATVFMLLFWISAGFVEEIIFRGYLVIENKGRKILWAGILGVSFLFALLHMHIIEWVGADEGFLAYSGDAAGYWWTFMLFAKSVFWYWLRFNPMNPKASIAPCFTSHIAANVAVFVVKLLQGKVTGWV